MFKFIQNLLSKNKPIEPTNPELPIKYCRDWDTEFIESFKMLSVDEDIALLWMRKKFNQIKGVHLTSITHHPEHDYWFELRFLCSEEGLDALTELWKLIARMNTKMDAGSFSRDFETGIVDGVTTEIAVLNTKLHNPYTESMVDSMNNETIEILEFMLSNN